jgi:hypothetical protein
MAAQNMFKKNILLFFSCGLIFQPLDLFPAETPFKDGAAYRPNFINRLPQPATPNPLAPVDPTFEGTSIAGETPLTESLVLPGDTPGDSTLDIGSIAGLAAGGAAALGMGGAALVARSRARRRKREAEKTQAQDEGAQEDENTLTPRASSPVAAGTKSGNAGSGLPTQDTDEDDAEGKPAKPSVPSSSVEPSPKKLESAAEVTPTEDEETVKPRAVKPLAADDGKAASGSTARAEDEDPSTPRPAKPKPSDDPLEAELERIKQARRDLKNTPQIAALKEAAQEAKDAHQALSDQHADLEVERNKTKSDLVKIQGEIQIQNAEIKRKQDAGEDTAAEQEALEKLATRKREMLAIAESQDASSAERILKLNALKEKQSIAEAALTKAQEPSKKKLAGLKRQSKVLKESQAQSTRLKTELVAAEKKLATAQLMHRAANNAGSQADLDKEQAKYDAHAKALDDHRALTLKQMAKAATDDPNKSKKPGLFKRLKKSWKSWREASGTEDDDDDKTRKKPGFFGKIAARFGKKQKPEPSDTAKPSGEEKVSRLKQLTTAFKNAGTTAKRVIFRSKGDDASPAPSTTPDSTATRPAQKAAAATTDPVEKRLNTTLGAPLSNATPLKASPTAGTSNPHREELRRRTEQLASSLDFAKPSHGAYRRGLTATSASRQKKSEK